MKKTQVFFENHEDGGSYEAHEDYETSGRSNADGNEETQENQSQVNFELPFKSVSLKDMKTHFNDCCPVASEKEAEENQMKDEEVLLALKENPKGVDKIICPLPCTQLISPKDPKADPVSLKLHFFRIFRPDPMVTEPIFVYSEEKIRRKINEIRKMSTELKGKGRSANGLNLLDLTQEPFDLEKLEDPLDLTKEEKPSFKEEGGIQDLTKEEEKEESSNSRKLIGKKRRKVMMDPPSQDNLPGWKIQKAIELHEKGHSFPMIDSALGFLKGQAQSLWNKQKQMQTQNPGAILTDSGKKWVPEYDAFLDNMLNKPEPSRIYSMKDMHEALKKEFPLYSTSLSNLHAHLKKNGFSFKSISRPINISNNQEIRLLRKGFVSKMVELFDQDSRFVFIDETSFKMANGPKKGWALKGKKIFLRKTRNLTMYFLAAAISHEGVLAYQIFKGGYTSRCHSLFMNGLCHFLKGEGVDFQKTYFIMDNVRSHGSEFVKATINGNIQVMFNAPYSPYLNPIEMIFGQWKQKVFKRTYYEEKALLTEVFKASQEFTKENMHKVFWHTLQHYEDCLNMNTILY